MLCSAVGARSHPSCCLMRLTQTLSCFWSSCCRCSPARAPRAATGATALLPHTLLQLHTRTEAPAPALTPAAATCTTTTTLTPSPAETHCGASPSPSLDSCCCHMHSPSHPITCRHVLRRQPQPQPHEAHQPRQGPQGGAVRPARLLQCACLCVGGGTPTAASSSSSTHAFRGVLKPVPLNSPVPLSDPGPLGVGHTSCRQAASALLPSSSG